VKSAPRIPVQRPSRERGRGSVVSWGDDTKGVDQAKLVRLVVEWLCQAAGGNVKYTGRDMVSAHAHLNMTDVHFMAAGDQIMRTLEKYGVPEPEAQEVLCAIVAHHDDVIR